MEMVVNGSDGVYCSEGGGDDDDDGCVGENLSLRWLW